jgi:hypothetical protein
MKPVKAIAVQLRITQVLPESQPIYRLGRRYSRHPGRNPASRNQTAFPGGTTMRATILSIAAAAALLPSLLGCCSQPQVARGQAPAAASQPSKGTYMTAYGDECDPNCFDESGRCRHCRGAGCRCCRPYRVPRNLSYPPQDEIPGVSSGIVQYPYYTCKGPDCFFKAN